MNFSLNKREFRDAVHLRYDWYMADTPSTCICGDAFTVDQAMVCRRGGFIIQTHNELRDLEADLLNTVCHDVQVEPDARLDVHARGYGIGKALPFLT